MFDLRTHLFIMGAAFGAAILVSLARDNQWPVYVWAPLGTVAVTLLAAVGARIPRNRLIVVAATALLIFAVAGMYLGGL